MDGQGSFNNYDSDSDVWRHLNDKYDPEPIFRYPAPETPSSGLWPDYDNIPFDLTKIPPELGGFDRLTMTSMPDLPPQTDPGTALSLLNEMAAEFSLQHPLPQSETLPVSGPTDLCGAWEPVFELVPPGQVVDCTHCKVLGQVYHSGPVDLLLTVHGGIFAFEHILFDVQYVGTGFIEQYGIDIRAQNLQWLQGFLMRYDIDIITLDGDNITSIVATSPNSLMAIYNNIQQFQLNHEGLMPFNFQPFQNQIYTPTSLNFIQGPDPISVRPLNTIRLSGPRLAVQRERTAVMTVDDLRPLFHMRTFEACKKLNICHTAFKGLCRRLHLRRWPYRKIQSISNQIVHLEGCMERKREMCDTDAVSRARKEIRRLIAERDRLYQFPFLEANQPPEKEYEGPEDHQGEEGGQQSVIT